jgi:hypothetical protein
MMSAEPQKVELSDKDKEEVIIGKRSLPFFPTVIYQDHCIHISSDVSLGNCQVIITNFNGEIVYSDVITLSAGGYFLLPISDEQEGMYTLELKYGKRQVCGVFNIEE